MKETEGRWARLVLGRSARCMFDGDCGRLCDRWTLIDVQIVEKGLIDMKG